MNRGKVKKMKKANSNKFTTFIAIISIALMMVAVFIPAAAMADEQSEQVDQQLAEQGIIAADNAASESSESTEPAEAQASEETAKETAPEASAQDSDAEADAASLGEEAPKAADDAKADPIASKAKVAPLSEEALADAVKVSTVEELMQAVNNSDATVINLTASNYQLKPQTSSVSYENEGYLMPDRDITFVSEKGATIENKVGKRHMYLWRNGNKDLSLTFDNVTLKGNEGGGIYSIGTGQLTLTGAEITDCKANDMNRYSLNGGAVQGRGNIVLNDCAFTNNSASESYGGMAGGDGGAVYATGTIKANHCFATGNSSTAEEGVGKFGGAFYSDSGITIKGGTYADNSAPVGGAVFVSLHNRPTAKIVIEDAILRGNSATMNGGGVANSVDLTAKNVQFIDNKSVLGGGAVISLGGSDTVIENCTFEGNTAGSEGGEGWGGAVNVDGGVSSALIKNSEFTGNSAKDGGAVSVTASKVTIEESAFAGNIATHYGGVLNLYYEASADITGSTMSGNKAGERGGAVYTNSLTALNIDDAKIKDNSMTGTAGFGGGLFTTGDATLKNSTLEGNSNVNGAGGGWYAFFGTPKADNITVKNNAAINGGGIYCAYAKLDLDHSKLEENNAKIGGAMFVYDSANYVLGVTLNDTTVTGNKAENTAGIYTYNRSLIKMNNSAFSANVSNDPFVWTISVALAGDPSDPDSLLHNENIVGTTYTAPYTNAYNNIDINYPPQSDICLHYVRNLDEEDAEGMDANVSPYNQVTLKDSKDADVTAWTPEDKQFDGWSYDRESTERIDAVVVYKSDVTVYAQWKDAPKDVEDTPTKPAIEDPKPPVVDPEDPNGPEDPKPPVIDPKPPVVDPKAPEAPIVEPKGPVTPVNPEAPEANLPDIQIDEPATNPNIPAAAQTPASVVVPSGTNTTVVNNPSPVVAAMPTNEIITPATAPAPVVTTDAAPDNGSLIDNQSTPFGLPDNGKWSLINLVIAIIVVLMMIGPVLTSIGKKKDASLYGAEEAAAYRKYNMLKLLSIIPAAVIGVLFFLLEDTSKQMGYIDQWTSLFLVVFLMQSVVILCTNTKTSAPEDTDTEKF